METVVGNYFTKEELSCPCCGECKFSPVTLARFNKLRESVGQPLPMTSGYRCETYNTLHGYTQTHATGQAGDLGVRGSLAVLVLSKAVECGFKGIGVNQKGTARFIHLDDASFRTELTIWSY